MARLWGAEWSRSELSRRVGRLQQVAGVRLTTLGDGAERGVRMLEFRTGSGFSFDVLVDRGFDIGRCEHAGRALGWQSATGWAGPWYHEPEGLGFLRGFGAGLLTTGGLDHTGFPTDDDASQYHYPPKQRERYGLHGRIAHRPATLRGYGERWEGDECVLWAEGEVVQAAVFGEQLVLRRRVEARLGESRLTIRDTVTNTGFDPTPHMLLYHVNMGWPVVDKGTELLLAARRTTPRGEHPVEGYRIMADPWPGYVEQAFEHEMTPEADGRVPVALVNRRLGLGAYEIYRAEQLPFLWVWRMLGEGTYVVGLEPSTNRTDGRLDARERAELIELAPGESRPYEIELGALAGEEIDSFERRVRALDPP